MEVSTVAQGVRFAAGLRRFLGTPVDPVAARQEIVDRWTHRAACFLRSMDELVWPVPTSPHRALLEHAGVDRGAVVRLVEEHGLDGALAVLRDEGVYVSYEEYTGQAAAQRGSRSFAWRPQDFLNPAVAADYMGSTSGTRSSGTPVGKSFAHLRALVPVDLLIQDLWGAPRAPNAVWLPVLPSSAGLNNVLRLGAAGLAPERWFSHVDPATREVSDAKRLANRVVPPLSRLIGAPLPRPEHVPASTPDAVLAWCLEALRRAGAAWVATYPTSAVALARCAVERGERLDGLRIRVGGEPLTAAKVAAIAAAGAVPVNGYAFAQAGRSAVSCPSSRVEELHVLEHHMALVTRRRPRADGVTVDALCWTSLDRSSPSVLLNTENDDYGRVWQDEEACGCLLGAMGHRTRLADVRGISKVLSGGITLDGERLERLAEVDLPHRFGGGPGDYQFGETELDGISRLVVRVAPRVGEVDEAAVARWVAEHLRSDDLGVLADAVWRGPGAVAVVREAPAPSRSGKVLTFEPLR